MKGIQDTSSKTYRQLMGNGLRYEIPKFQRDYTWESEQWSDLWIDLNDVLSEEEIDHYMGYLVLQTNNNKNFQIIDGQQRLTTLSVLILASLKCLSDLIENNIDSENNKIRKDNLHSSYIGLLDPVTLIANNKLKLNRNSDDYYKQHLVLLKELPIRNTNTSEKHMRECFFWYYERIKKQFNDGVKIASFVDKIVDKLFFTVIEVTDQINAFKVFETINARGVQLSSSDLLKNYLFSVVDDTKPHISEIEELENIWTSIVGKLGEQKFEDYLRYYWNSENKTVGKKQLFKSIKSNIKTKEEVFALIKSLNDTADLYLALLNPDDNFWKEKQEVVEYLAELKLFQIKQTNSLLIAGYKNLETPQFKKLVKTCAIISLRYNVISGLNPNEQENVYNSIARNITRNKVFDPQDFQAIYVSDNNFYTNFSFKEFKNTTRNHKIVRYILAKIENRFYQSDINFESDIWSIEHILPENADESWGEFSQEDLQHSKYRIGNLTLLEKKLNREADQLAFVQKKEILSKSISTLTKNISEEFDSWNLSKISERQRDLAKKAKEIWKIQEILIP